ncbi:MAG: hypothetical protein R2725_15125 [Solirubrobacterales bacterium]
MPRHCIDAYEGRAIAARPSVCLLLAAAALLAVAVPVAAATPVPVLIRTDPEDVGTELHPLVFGDPTGATTAVFPGARSAAVALGSGPEARIDLYGGESAAELCEGDPIGTGTAQQFEAVGIPVTVKELTTTYVSALQTDDEGAECSAKAIPYQHVDELPEEEEPPVTDPPVTEPPPGPPVPNDPVDGSAPPAPRLRTVPGGSANFNLPRVTGAAPRATRVKIYADPACKGPVVARGTATELAAGLPVQVADNVVVAFTGVSVAGGKASSCSAPAYYVEDSTLPRTRITFGPSFKTKRRKVVFRFADTNGGGPGTVFKCKLDRRKWKRCRSPLRLEKLGRRRHILRVKAIDAAGNRERRAAKRRFKVIRRR